MYSTELGINFFGNESNKKIQLNKIEILKKNINNFKIFLVIAGTDTSVSYTHLTLPTSSWV